MRNDPLSYRGALAILGHHDRDWLDRVDRLLGGAILLTPAALVLGPPAALVAAAWAWVDQKNEAVSLVRKALDVVGRRVSRTQGHERHLLVAAAHTALVCAALMETLHEMIGVRRLRTLTPSELWRVVLDVAEPERDHLLTQLYTSPVPAPSAGRGYEENVATVAAWYAEASTRLRTFLGALDPSVVPSQPAALFPALVEAATARYRSLYLQIATQVPEFLVWTSFAEHAATRSTVAALGEDLSVALGSQGAALRRVESLLAAMAPVSAPRLSDPCAVLRRANRAALDEPIVPARWWRRPGELVRFPSLASGYVDPAYRTSAYHLGSALSDDEWWQRQPVHDDLDIRLVTYLTSPVSTRLPLLVLGHPGAGKSLLTKVLAARLPESWYTVVRVPLRQVGASDPVYEQIQTALDALTHRRVSWADLVEYSLHTIRVVLLDGLDELLQASDSERAGYLREVEDFQRREAAQDRPVAVVVTSRLVVADQVRIPLDVPVIRLEDFDDGRVRRWLSAWNDANGAAVENRAPRLVPAEACLRHPAIATQPLLLLMLALYLTDPRAPTLDTMTSTTDLYGALLSSFASREVSRTMPELTTEAHDEAVRDQLWRLAVAAFAMFNRGRQDITDLELGQDLRAMGDTAQTAGPARLGQRTFGQFFFVHAAEADGARPEETRHRYEFLHATFGEYLIASHTVQELSRLAGADRRPLRRDIPDDLLFAVLSHQSFALRDNILRLSADLFTAVDSGTRPAVLRVLDELIVRCRQRQRSNDFAEYRPLPVDQVRELAAYSANLILLRTSLDPDGLTLDGLWPEADPHQRWLSTVNLWQAGLDLDGWHAMLSSVVREERRVRRTEPGDAHAALPPDLAYAALVGTEELSSSSSRVITELSRSFQYLDNAASPLSVRFAQNEIRRIAELVTELSRDASVNYDGEDRDWLLNLTNAATTSVDATSLTPDLVDSGMWTGDLGVRYLEAQRVAISRGVRVRRVFIVDGPRLMTDQSFREIVQMQLEIGVAARLLDVREQRGAVRRSLFDFVVFDGAISYETTPAPTLIDGTTTIVNTRLELQKARVRDRIVRFEDIWRLAQDPPR